MSGRGLSTGTTTAAATDSGAAAAAAHATQLFSQQCLCSRGHLKRVKTAGATATAAAVAQPSQPRSGVAEVDKIWQQRAGSSAFALDSTKRWGVTVSVAIPAAVQIPQVSGNVSL